MKARKFSAELKRRAHINAGAKDADNAPDFSEHIRLEAALANDVIFLLAVRTLNPVQAD